MNTYYFTFGDNPPAHPYKGGWVEVLADTENLARKVFLALYGECDSLLLPCASVYTEERFKETSMYKNGNFGARCHKRIRLIMEDC